MLVLLEQVSDLFWRWYKSPDLYHYQHVSDVYFLNIFALLMRQETRKCWYKSGDLNQRQRLRLGPIDPTLRGSNRFQIYFFQFRCRKLGGRMGGHQLAFAHDAYAGGDVFGAKDVVGSHQDCHTFLS